MSLFPMEDKKDRLTIVNIDKILYSYFMKYLRENKMNLQMAKEPQIRSVLQACISILKHKYPDIKLIDFAYLQFLRKEIAWMKSCNYMELEIYQKVDRIGRTSSNGEGPQKILKNSKIREAIFYLSVLFQQKMAEQKLFCFEDISLFALKYLKSHKVDQFTHILIDESQDLTKVQLECLMKLYHSEKDYSSIIFIADTAQSIYDTSWLTKGRNFTSIGLDMTGKSNSLAKNYRTTTQIAEAAYSLIAKDANVTQDEHYVKPSLIDKQGNYPVLRGFATLQEEISYVKDLILSKLEKRYELRDIAIVARTNRILKEVNIAFDQEISNSLFSANDMDFGVNDVKLLTMHSIKGLEFKVVILLGLSNKIIPNLNAITIHEDQTFIESMERKLLYVGMTRATERLYLSYHEEKSKFIEEIEARYLKLQDSAKLRTFYHVPVQNYVFADILYDIYSKEEGVRQWFLKELVETYKYPVDLIQVEHKVQLFSRVGYVDIAISIYRNNKLVPYIMVEIKQQDSDIISALEQVKSYMSVTNECCYGVACNGNDFIVINRNFEYVEDIPMFDHSMLPSSIESFTFIDVRTNHTHCFYIDADNPQEVILEDEGRQEVWKGNRLVPLNVFTDIAAGAPILLNEEVTDQVYLPFEWVNYPFESFVLHVKGDSMKEADILNGDRVILRRQNTADNGQIAAVEVDGGITLKRFRKMGNMICLIPENEEYEPIVVDSSMVRIIGVIVGIIKKK